MSAFQIYEGSRLPHITATLSDANGVFNLTGYTVEFTGRRQGGDTTIGGAAVVVSASDGTVRYEWDANDTATPGTYLCSWKVTRTSGSLPMYFPSPQTGYITVVIAELLSD